MGGAITGDWEWMDTEMEGDRHPPHVRSPPNLSAAVAPMSDGVYYSVRLAVAGILACRGPRSGGGVALAASGDIV